MKTTIDLSTLEQGDEVIFRGGQKAVINQLTKQLDNDGVTIDFFVYDHSSSLTDFYLVENGKLVNERNNYYDIIEVIKNPRRWTDEDMKAAFDAEKPAFDTWFQQYKVKKDL